MMKNYKRLAGAIAIAITTSSIFGSVAYADTNKIKGNYVAGDFHTHTFLSDGSKVQSEVAKNAFEKYGLDWMANSEHGGTSDKDPFGNKFTVPDSASNTSIWRWITLKDYSFPIIRMLQKQYPNKVLIQGFEWNVPTHEHASVGIISDNAQPISDFEYMYDQKDTDTTRTAEIPVKKNSAHGDAVAAAKFLQTNYQNTSYFLINHPSRKLKYSAADIRDFNDAAPDVCFGMEGLPGHQKEADRGGYSDKDPKAKTYGGADYMVAKVGGLWDSLLGEGRKFWVFINSDFHDNNNGDFWPGEYGKSYTYVSKNSAEGIVNGMRSGNSYAVQGDLINALDFTINQDKKENTKAVMGEELKLSKGSNANVTIKFKSPDKNNHGDAVQVDHIDLISGSVTKKANPGTNDYEKDTNETTKIIKTFDKSQWTTDGEWNVIKFTVKNISKDMYFRLRGSNLCANTQNETDEQGNPLADELVGTNTETKAYADLWFYSNPIFVSIK